MNEYIVFGALLVLALSFDFLNGFHDAANVVATIIASRALSPRAALTLAAICELLGPLLFGVAVAVTVGSEIVDPRSVTITMVMAALVAASSWNIFTWWGGIPSSSSHALAGGLVGSAVAFGGLDVLRVEGVGKVALALFVSPVLGFMVGWVVLRILFFLARGATPRVNQTFNRIQILTAGTLALSHGANDAQKTMGVITMGLVTLGFQERFYVPTWVVVVSAVAIALGTAAGGWRIIRTLGGKFYKIRPVHSLASQVGAASVILGASLWGGPVSTTHVVSSAIVGVGAAQRRSQVRWLHLMDILVAWAITVPVTALLGSAVYLGFRLVLGA